MFRRPVTTALLALLGVAAAPAQEVPRLRETRTAAGLRIWQIPSTHAGFALVVRVGVGSRDEADGEAGIAHFLEHVLFESTQGRSGEALRELFRSHDADENGVTTADHTAYFAGVSAARWRTLVEVLGEMITRPAFVDSEVAKQRRIVLEELDERGGGTSLRSVLYPDHPLGRAVGGDASSVASIDVEALRAFHARHYRADNIVVAFTGPVPSADIVLAIEAAFADAPRGSTTRSRRPPVPFVGERALNAGGLLQARGSMWSGYHIPERGPEALAAVLVLEKLLQESLREEVREKRHLSYAPHVTTDLLEDAWRVDFEVRVSDRRKLESVDEAIEVIVGQLASTLPDPFERVRGSVRVALHVGGAPALEKLVRLLALTTDGSTAPADLDAVLRELDSTVVFELARRCLVPENRFTLTDAPRGFSALRSSPWALLFLIVLFALFDGLRGFPWTRALRVRVQDWKARHRARRRRAKAPAVVARRRDVDRLEREIQDFYRDRD